MLSQNNLRKCLNSMHRLVFDASLEAMADLALERKTGARGLCSILEKIS